jgi:uncharacterized membrane protein YccC
MLGWARRLPAHALNGVSVGVGVGLVQLLTLALLSAEHARGCATGAVLASLPHLTGRAVPTLRRTLVGGLLASLVTLAVMTTAGHRLLRALSIALISFVALLGMAWGARAASIVFSIIIGLVFALAEPASRALLPEALAIASGATLYALWAFVSAKLLEPRYRSLAVFNCLEAAAALLRARALVLTQAEREPEPGAEDNARFGQLSEELRLAQALQQARDLVYPAAQRRGGALLVALLSRVAELREIVLTARLDLDLLGRDHAARFVRARLALGLRQLAELLEQLARLRELSLGARAEGSLPLPELPDLLEAASLIDADDPRARLLPVVAARLRYLREEVEALRALLLGDPARSSLGPAELEQYVADDDTWPLSALQPHLSLDSPVLRHALRSSLGFTSVYALATALPWTTKPYWMLLSVAVVLRGTLDDTLSRRNARVLGTAIGCALATALVALFPDPVLKLSFAAAVGVAHAFVNIRYLLTAISATIMALLQAHFAAPGGPPLVFERLLDTVLGALFAWAFSYVLPSWERRTLPIAIERALEALRAYSDSALELHAVRAEQRLLRQRAYDALGVVAAALRRSAAEPRRVRPPVEELVLALDHAQRLMAHLSSLRSLLQRRAQRLPTGEASEVLAEARRRVDEHLSRIPPPERRARQASYGELPLAPVEQEPLPWLLRRLDASVHDAKEAGVAIRAALRRLETSGATRADESA